ncbi:hypothetical protein ON010_g8193 [Phytophthora cinnamomi]|nr:hypothetical protein ON010_g8193 [Phytophthora cinnamomi]
MVAAFGNANPAIQEVQANKPTLLPIPAADSNSSESHIDQPGSGKSKPSVAAEAQLQTTKLQTSGMVQERWSGNVQTKVTAKTGSKVVKYNFEPIVCTLVGLLAYRGPNTIVDKANNTTGTPQSICRGDPGFTLAPHVLPPPEGALRATRLTSGKDAGGDAEARDGAARAHGRRRPRALERRRPGAAGHSALDGACGRRERSG